jgi:hypothetical protein
MLTLLDNHKSDTEILSMLVENKKSAWAHLYDKYAPLMYGTILKMTGDETLAEAIFEIAFVELKERKILSPPHVDIRHSLLRYTYKITLKNLKVRGLKAHPLNAHYPLINLFYFEQISLKEAATKLDITELAVLKQLRAEFNHFCNRSK